MTLLTLGNLSLIIFSPPSILLRILIKSSSCHLLYTGRFIGSNLMPPVSKFRIVLLTITLFMVSMNALMMLLPLFRVFRKKKKCNISGGAFTWKRWYIILFYVCILWVVSLLLFPHLAETFNWLNLESLTSKTHYI